MAWWGNSLDKNSFQPKQKNRFLVQMGQGGNLLSVSTVTKPTVSIETKEFKMINHYYNYPGIPRWEPITITFVDGKIWGDGAIRAGREGSKLKEEYTATMLWEMLTATGYVTPRGAGPSRGTEPVVTPEKAANIDKSFGSFFKIYQLDHMGEKSTETWTIHNPVISKISWGDLDYASNDLVQYTLDITYDWAELTSGERIRL